MRLGRALSPKRPFLGRLDAAVPSPTEPRGRGLPALSAAMLGAALLLASGPAVAQQPGVPVAEPTPAPNPAVPASVAPAATVAPPRAIPPPRRAPSAGFTERLQSIIARAGGPQGGTESLVVLSSAPDQKLQVNLREDLAIMARILAKAVDPVQPSDSRVMGVNLAFAQDAGSLRRVYLEGYGALFLFNVGFPLIAPLAADEKGEESPKGNSAWEEARQEVLGEPGPVGMGTAAPPEPYSAEKVDRMKSAILEALKNASNIRGLKNDEGVTVCVLGNQGLPLAHIGGGSMAYAGAGAPAMLAGSGPAAAPSAVLSIRLMKPDIDAFSKGQLDLDQFRKKARITLYATEPGGATVGGFGAGGFGGGGFGGGGGGGGGFGGGR